MPEVAVPLAVDGLLGLEGEPNPRDRLPWIARDGQDFAEALLEQVVGLQAVDLEVPFNSGFEGFEDWDPKEFNTILVEGAYTNAWGNLMGYELEPLRTGTARHFAQASGGQELWSQHDFWVTRADRPETVAWSSPWKNPDDYLVPFINGKSVSDGPVALWYLTSAHHGPTDEDRDLNGNFAVTLTHWFGFSLRPHNFFDHNPLGGPSKCDP